MGAPVETPSLVDGFAEVRVTASPSQPNSYNIEVNGETVFTQGVAIEFGGLRKGDKALVTIGLPVSALEFEGQAKVRYSAQLMGYRGIGNTPTEALRDLLERMEHDEA